MEPKKQTLGQVLSSVSCYVKWEPSDQSAFHQAISNWHEEECERRERLKIEAVIESIVCDFPKSKSQEEHDHNIEVIHWCENEIKEILSAKFLGGVSYPS